MDFAEKCRSVLIPDVSVVIVSWNVADLLADCLDSLDRYSSGLSLEVWVVDNASSDHTVEMLKERYPKVHVIANKDNRGFAKANNQAIRQATGRFVLILNPDTIVANGALKTLFDFLVDHPEAGMAGPCLCNANGEQERSSARRPLSLAWALWVEALKMHTVPLIGNWIIRKLLFPYNLGITQEVESISGAAMLARREILQDMDGFGETFFHCGEDVDLCFRIHAMGWRIYYLSESVIVHLKGQSSKKAPVRTTVNAALSNQEFFRRCRSRWQATIYRLITQCIRIPQMFVVGSIKCLLRKESAEDWKRRLEVCRRLLAWRKVE